MSVFTNTPRNDGFGSQFQDTLWAMLYTENSGNKFKYTRPKKFEHNYNNDEKFTEKLVNYMKFDEYNPDGPIDKALKHEDTYGNIQSSFDKYLNSKSFFKYKKIFYSDKSSPYDKAYTHVAVHVRRKNKDDNRIEGTNTPDLYYLNIIDIIRRKHSNCKFHIYSQGDISNFSAFIADDTIIHLDDDVLNTFDGLVFADILVTSASSFSYVAAMLTNGIVFYKKFWHVPSNKWIIC